MKIRKPVLLFITAILTLSGCENPQPAQHTHATVVYSDIKSQRLEVARE